MADERQFGTQELVSAKYFVESQDGDEPEVQAATRQAPRRRSGLENIVRLLTPVVIVMLLIAAGGIYGKTALP